MNLHDLGGVHPDRRKAFKVKLKKMSLAMCKKEAFITILELLFENSRFEASASLYQHISGHLLFVFHKNIFCSHDTTISGFDFIEKHITRSLAV